MSESERESAIERLAMWGDAKLPREMRAELVEMGSAVVPALVAALGSEEHWVPVQAATMLGEIGDPAAIEPLLEALAACERGTVLHDHLIFALEDFGQAALEPALAAHDRSDDPEFRGDVLCALSSSGARDERLFALLMEALEAEWQSGECGIAPANLAEYGDPRAVGRLVELLDAVPDDIEPPEDDQVLFELEDAIETLGGMLTPEQKDRVARARAARRAFYARPRNLRALEAAARASIDPPAREPARRVSRPGRNECCWCGSGRKYKKCHLAADEAPGAAPPS